MFFKINQFILHSILILTPCVLAVNNSKDSGQDAAETRFIEMTHQKNGLENRNPWGSGSCKEVNPFDDYGSATDFLLGKDPILMLFPGLLLGGIIDLAKAPVVAIRGVLAEFEAQKLGYNLTLMKELSESCKDPKNINKLHKEYSEKKEFNGLTLNTLRQCMVEQLKEPIPDGDVTKVKAVDFKSNSFQKKLLAALKKT